MTYKYITIEPRAVFPGEDTEAYRAGAISERALALAAPTLQLRVEELMEEIRQIKTLGNEKLRWVTVPDGEQEYIGDGYAEGYADGHDDGRREGLDDNPDRGSSEIPKRKRK